MKFTKEQINLLLKDYIPEVKTESLLNRDGDLVELTFYWNKYASRWEDKDSAKKGWVLYKIDQQVKRLIE